ncbi:TRAP-type C4-dicarboxylate transport system substrate-binding protein [Rhodoligotrophos appendicifer]|uniref:TRAP transporter substrate-binding protein DctP n=1 Tax=Rhodoligotrophos appendicifer TaxID=987056 RepID=UPI0011800FFE|nr:TRAP transporter substrate-binding protein DctP [Rhodoligotrophos appendicifer]
MLSLRTRLKALTLAAVGAGFVTMAGPATAEVALVFSTHTGPGSISSTQYNAYLDELTKRTNGEVTIKDKFYSQALIKATDQAKGIAQGLADVGYVCVGYSPSLFPLTGMGEMPYLSQHGDSISSALTELYETNADFKAEFERQGLVPIAMDAPSPTIIGVSREIKSADDLKGLKVRAYGELGNIVAKGGGMTPVPMSTAEIATSMQTGVIDGYVGVPLWMPYPENWLSHTKTIVDPGIGTYYSCGLMMSANVYNALSDDVKKVIGEMRREFPAKSIAFVMAGDKATVEAAKKEGVGFYKFTPEEVAAWKERVNQSAMEGEWIKARSTKTNADVAAFFEELKKSVAKHDPQTVYVSSFPAPGN